MSPSNLTKTVAHSVQKILEGQPDEKKLEMALRHLSKWRAILIENSLVANEGRKVLSGPFQGMNYDIKVTEGAAPARLIGCYEASLVPVLDEIIARAYPVVMDIGCAEGYYAVGLARRMPKTTVLAFDTNPKAQLSCKNLAALNEVADRVKVGGTVSHDDFERCRKSKTLVLCDIEGAEDALLDPPKAPALIDADILVETHDCFSSGLSDRISSRFNDTHTIIRIGRDVDMKILPDWMEEYSDLDRLIALWEWRMGPTSWLWMQARN